MRVRLARSLRGCYRVRDGVYRLGDREISLAARGQELFVTRINGVVVNSMSLASATRNLISAAFRL